MNFKKQASTLKTFLDEEFKTRTPLLVLDNKQLLYKNFKIKESKSKKWTIRFLAGHTIDGFYLKTSAAIAAKYYDSGNFKKLNELKLLDFQYWQSASDEEIFKHKIKITKDLDKLDIYVARWELASAKSKLYKQQIIDLFRLAFDK
jgi:hypothetical protein